MRWVLALTVASAILITGLVPRRRAITGRLGEYLGEVEVATPAAAPRVLQKWQGAWLWVMAGAFAGALVAQGDLFISGPGRSIPALAALGGAAGWFIYSARLSTAKENRIRRMRFELPVIADTLAMEIVSGESVATAIDSVCNATKGEVASDLAVVLDRARSDMGLPESLLAAAADAPHPDVRRLYETLAHAHTVGGRLNDALTELAKDFRASLERDLTAEGGRRAITSYGPVIALMVPTALLFLLYPTLLGLRSLSGG